MLLLIVVGDEDGVLIPDLEEVFVLGHEDVQGLGEAHVGQLHRDLLAQVDPLVVEKVDAAGLAQGVVNLANRLILEFQRNGNVGLGIEARSHPARHLGLGLHFLHFAGFFPLAALEFLNLLRQFVDGVLVGGIQEDRLLELRNGGFRLARGGVLLPALEMVLGGPQARPGKRHLVPDLTRLLGQRFGKCQHRLIEVLPFHESLPLAVRSDTGAAHQGEKNQEEKRDSGCCLHWLDHHIGPGVCPVKEKASHLTVPS